MYSNGLLCMCYRCAVADLHTGKPGHLPRLQNELNYVAIMIFIIDLTTKAEEKVLRL